MQTARKSDSHPRCGKGCKATDLISFPGFRDSSLSYLVLDLMHLNAEISYEASRTNVNRALEMNPNHGKHDR